MQARLDQLRTLVASHEASAVLVTALPDIRWACGFTGSNGLLLVTRDGAHFITDGRYAEQAAREVEGATVHVPGYELVGHLTGASLLTPGMTVLLQAEHVSLALAAHLQQALPDVVWRPVERLLVRLVARKDDREVERIRRAQQVTEEVFEEVLTWLRPGLTEREVAAEIVHAHLRRGAERMAFDPIVASGPNGARPHARPSDRVLATGDLVVLDFGGVVDGYASDMTRTVALGEPGEEARRVYEAVRTAQARALEAARAGIKASALDAVARDELTAAGFGEAFPHSLGHGIGLRTHEWPTLSARSDDLLPEHAAVTIEPGVYLPGRFGVRIEDIVLLRTGGCDNLTSAPKDLIVL